MHRLPWKIGAQQRELLKFTSWLTLLAWGCIPDLSSLTSSELSSASPTCGPDTSIMKAYISSAEAEACEGKWLLQVPLHFHLFFLLALPCRYQVLIPSTKPCLGHWINSTYHEQPNPYNKHMQPYYYRPAFSTWFLINKLLRSFLHIGISQVTQHSQKVGVSNNPTFKDDVILVYGAQLSLFKKRSESLNSSAALW